LNTGRLVAAGKVAEAAFRFPVSSGNGQCCAPVLTKDKCPCAGGHGHFFPWCGISAAALHWVRFFLKKIQMRQKT